MFCIIYINCNFCIVLDVTYYYINQIIYLQGQRQNFGGGGASDKISFMISSKILYCNGVAKISVREDIQQKCTHQRLLNNFLKFIQICTKILKILQILLKIEFKKIFKNLKQFNKIFKKL